MGAPWLHQTAVAAADYLYGIAASTGPGRTSHERKKWRRNECRANIRITGLPLSS